MEKIRFKVRLSTHNYVIYKKDWLWWFIIWLQILQKKVKSRTSTELSIERAWFWYIADLWVYCPFLLQGRETYDGTNLIHKNLIKADPRAKDLNQSQRSHVKGACFCLVTEVNATSKLINSCPLGIVILEILSSRIKFITII